MTNTKDDVPLFQNPSLLLISAKVVMILEENKISLQDILTMTRQEFSDVNRLLRPLVSGDERDTLINFKIKSMTPEELRIHNEPTEEEYNEIDNDPEYPKFKHRIS